MAKKSCADCAINPRPGQQTCLRCHRRYMRAWRKLHPPDAEQRQRQNCRRYALIYLTRGKLKKLPCRVCGRKDSQMHHPDYSKPLKVHWYCRQHHLELHKKKD